MKFVLIATIVLTAAAHAHHGSADYDVDREVTVSGVVKEWRWTNPHTWVYVTVTKAGGAIEQWEGEGPPLTWASQRGWSGATLRNGEDVSLVMYPSRRAARAGLVKRIERPGREPLIVSRPWLDAR
jgi:hypothetical protein